MCMRTRSDEGDEEEKETTTRGRGKGERRKFHMLQANEVERECVVVTRQART